MLLIFNSTGDWFKWDEGGNPEGKRDGSGQKKKSGILKLEGSQDLKERRGNQICSCFWHRQDFFLLCIAVIETSET